MEIKKNISKYLKPYLKTWFVVPFLLCLLIMTPLFSLLFSSIQVDEKIWKHILNNLFLEYSLNTIILAFGVAFFTFIIGVGNAWIVTFSKYSTNKLIDILLIAPLAIPSFASSYAYSDLLDHSGFIQSKIREYFHYTNSDKVLPNINSLGGAIFILSITLYPYVYILARNSFKQQSRKTIDAALILGASNINVFLRIALPLARPAIAAGIVLVIMESIADFGTVYYLGVDTLSIGIYKTWFGFGDLNSAARMSLVLLALSGVLILLEKNNRRGKTNDYPNIKTYNFFSMSFIKKKSLVLSLIFSFLTIFLSLIIPILWLIKNSLQANFDEIYYSIIPSLINTIYLGLLGSITVVTVALVFCFSSRFFSGILVVISNFAKLGYAAPGAVVAIGVMIPLTFLDKITNNATIFLFDLKLGLIFSGTILALIFAYLVRFLSVAYNPIEAAYSKLSINFDSVAFSLGSNLNHTLKYIHIPIIKKSLFIAMLLVFIDIIKELPASLILRPLNFDTLAIVAFEFSSSEQLNNAAFPSLMIFSIGLIPLIILYKKING